MCYVMLLLSIAQLTQGYGYPRLLFSTLPEEILDYWNERVQFCGTSLSINLRMTCDMYYSGEKSPFRQLYSLTNPVSLSRKRRQLSHHYLISECCLDKCTRWALKDFCLQEYPDFNPEPMLTTITTTMPPKTEMTTTKKYTAAATTTTTTPTKTEMAVTKKFNTAATKSTITTKPTSKTEYTSKI